MSLNLKYLLVLNMVILAVWGVHAWTSVADLEASFLRSEAETLERLAQGLRLHLETVIREGRSVESAQAEVERLAETWGDVDLMVIAPDFRVVAASQQANLGRTWHEEAIASVFAGRQLAALNVEGHWHDGRRASGATTSWRRSRNCWA